MNRLNVPNAPELISEIETLGLETFIRKAKKAEIFHSHYPGVIEFVELIRVAPVSVRESIVLSDFKSCKTGQELVDLFNNKFNHS